MKRLSYSNLPEFLNGEKQIFDIAEAIHNDASENFKNYVPLPNADNVIEFGRAVNQNKTLQNEFITALIDRVAGIILDRVQLTNPFEKFKTADLNYGRTLEEIFIDVSDEHAYDPELAEKEVFKREVPTTETVFHSVNREGFFKQTIQDASLKRAFVSWEEFGEFTAGIINAMYNSDSVNEFLYVKLLLESFYSNGGFATVKVPEVVDTVTAKDFIKAVRKSVRKMTMQPGSRDYNAMAVRNIAQQDDLHLFISADLEAEVDVEVLASAFNMDKGSFNTNNVTVIEEFEVPGLQAIIVDKSFFIFKDVVKEMESQRNGQGLYWNYFLHRHQMISGSPFAPAIAFTTDENAPLVSSVILNPKESSITAGNTIHYKTYVRQLDNVKRPVSYSVESLDGQPLDGTTIDENGVLSISESQKGKLKVTAKVEYQMTETVLDENDEEVEQTYTDETVGNAFVIVKQKD